MAGREPAASLGKRMEALALTVVLIVITLGLGWLVWSVREWRSGRTPSYRVLGLRVVRRSDGQPIGLIRSLVRSLICGLLVLPTSAVCCIIGFCFVFGASAPDDLLRRPRTAPWDYLTATKVTDERTRPRTEGVVLGPIDLSGVTRPSETHNQNWRAN